MIPQMLSSPAAATGRTPPPSDAPRDPRLGDADAAAFTLGTEDPVGNALEVTDMHVPVPVGPEIARTPGETVRADSFAAFAEPAPRRAADGTVHEERPNQLPAGQTGKLPGATTATMGGAIAQPQVQSPAHDTKGHGATGPASPEVPAETAAPDLARPDVRNAAAATVVAPARAREHDRIDRVPAMRDALTSASGDAPENDESPKTGASPEGKTLDTAKAQGTGAAPVAAAAADSAPVPADRVASSADAAAAPQDVDTARADTGRTDAARAEPPRADLTRTVSGQLVEAIRHGAGGNTDVALNPEELGRVRLSLMAKDGVLHVSVLAERPETHDLLRRNIGLLQSDFRALGYSDVAFDFGQGGQRPDNPERLADTAPMTADTPADSPVATADAPAAHQRPTAASARLDLRL